MIRSVRKLLKLSMVTGLDVEQDNKVEDDEDHTSKCIPYLKGKTTCKVITKKSNSDCSRTLYRLFSDVCGPFDVEGSMQSRYFVTLIDGHSHYMKVKPIKAKDKVVKVLKEWILQSEVETGETVNFLQTDGGGEYIGADFQDWLSNKGIHHKVTNAGTPQENGTAEHLNRTILEMTRSMLLGSNLPKTLWPFVVNYTQEILNRLPTQALTEDKTPYKVYFGKKLLVRHLQTFGCQSFVHVPGDKHGKLDPKVVQGFFVSIPNNRKGYIIVHDKNHLKLYVSCNMTFVKLPDRPEWVKVEIDELNFETRSPKVKRKDKGLAPNDDGESPVTNGRVKKSIMHNNDRIADIP